MNTPAPFRTGVRSLDETADQSGSGAEESRKKNRVTKEGTQLDATGLWKGAIAPARSPRPKMQKRLPMPGSIPTGNAYNILLHLEHGPRDEWDRVLQIAREGLAAARHARQHLLSLKGAVPDDAQLLVDVVCDHIASRNTFGDAFREAAQRLVHDMHRWGLPNEELSTILNRLERALEATETVEDVNAAALALRPWMGT